MPDMPTIAQTRPATPTAPDAGPHRATAAGLDRLWHDWQSRFTGGRSPCCDLGVLVARANLPVAGDVL